MTARAQLGTAWSKRAWVSLRLVAVLALSCDAVALQPVHASDDNLRFPQAWKICEADAQCVRIPNGCGEVSVNVRHAAAARAQSFAIAGNPAQLNCSAPSGALWSAPVCFYGTCKLLSEAPSEPWMSLAESRRFLARSAEYEACRVEDDCAPAADLCGGPHAVNKRYVGQFEAASRVASTAVECAPTKRWSKDAGPRAVGCEARRCTIKNPNVLYPDCPTCGAGPR